MAKRKVKRNASNAARKGNAKPTKKKDVQRSLPIEQLPKENLNYTFFAACGNYPKKGYEHFDNVWWSRNRFGQQLWKEIDNRVPEERYQYLGPKYNGHIPQKVLEDILAEELFNGQDFRKIYKNWAFVWQIGTSKYVNGRYEDKIVERENSKGEKKSYVQKVYKADLLTNPIETKEGSKGNPPTTSYTREEREAYRAMKQEQDEN